MLTVSQAAAALGISDATVYALVGSGELEAYRFSAGAGRGTIRIEPEALAAYKASRRIQSAKPSCPSLSTAHASAGNSNLSAQLPGAGSALANYFRQGGIAPKPKNTTASKQRAFTPLRLASANQSR